jgi:hypothetical protein
MAWPGLRVATGALTAAPRRGPEAQRAQPCAHLVYSTNPSMVVMRAGVADRQRQHWARRQRAPAISKAAVFWPSMRKGLWS